MQGGALETSLYRTGVRGERPGICIRSNFQAKSTLFSILPTVALKEEEESKKTAGIIIISCHSQGGP